MGEQERRDAWERQVEKTIGAVIVAMGNGWMIREACDSLAELRALAPRPHDPTVINLEPK